MKNNTRPQKKFKPKPHADTCGFCNREKKKVPLMVKSPVTNNTICAYCAMNIVEQTMGHMVNVSSAFSQVVEAKPEWFDQDPVTGAISMIDPEKTLDKLVDDSNVH